MIRLFNKQGQKKKSNEKLLFIFLIPCPLTGPVKFLLYYVRLVNVCTVPFTVLSPSRARAARTLKELASSKCVFSKKTQSRILFLICSCWFYLQFKIRLASVTVSGTYCSKKCYNWPDNHPRPLLPCSLSTQHTAARYEKGVRAAQAS